MVNKSKVKIQNLDGYEEFTKFVDNLPKKTSNVFFLFTGKKKENGMSWCIFCALGKVVGLLADSSNIFNFMLI